MGARTPPAAAPAEQQGFGSFLAQEELRSWLEEHGRTLSDAVRQALRDDLRKQDARWQSLNARVDQLSSRLDALVSSHCQTARQLADALYALRNELQAERARHRDPFGVFAALLRDLRPQAVRQAHAVWDPKAVDAYLRETWQLTDPEIRAYKSVWREAHLIAVERDNYARKFTIARGVVAYRFAVPTSVFALFHTDPQVSAEAATEVA